MLSLIIIGFVVLFILAFVIALPFAFIKIMKTEKQLCPSCENEIRFAQNHGRCPKCRAKIFKHGDGTLHLRT